MFVSGKSIDLNLVLVWYQLNIRHQHQYRCLPRACRFSINQVISSSLYFLSQEGEKKVLICKRNPKPKVRTCQTDTELIRSSSLPNKKPLILTRTTKAAQSASSTTTTPPLNSISEDGDTADHIQPGLLKLLLASETGTSHNFASLSETLLSEETRASVCELSGDSGMLTASCLTLSQGEEHQLQGASDSAVTVLCCESLGPFSDGGEAAMDADALQEALGQTFSLVPIELVKGETIVDCILEDGGPGEGEHVSIYEHSYCRPDTDKELLWSKILSLHTKILEMDRREESTVAKIRALESEILHLKRDSAVFKEKQKMLEDHITSILL